MMLSQVLQYLNKACCSNGCAAITADLVKVSRFMKSENLWHERVKQHAIAVPRDVWQYLLLCSDVETKTASLDAVRQSEQTAVHELKTRLHSIHTERKQLARQMHRTQQRAQSVHVKRRAIARQLLDSVK